MTRAADLRRSGTLRWLRPCREKEGPLPEPYPYPYPYPFPYPYPYPYPHSDP